jgi:hypothetical protein
MKKNILTRERLAAIERAIERNGGEITSRNLDRIHGIKWSVLNEAQGGGFVELFERKGRRGRPSLLVRKVNRSCPTKLPPRRSQVEQVISSRHWNFAFNYALGECGPGTFDFKRRAYVAYQKAFPEVKSKGAAKSGASRLLRQPHIRAAIQWQFAKLGRENKGQPLFPNTTFEIWTALREIGSFRADWAPWWVKYHWTYEEEDNEETL